MVFRLGKRARRPSIVAILLFLALPRPSGGPQIPLEDTLREARRLAWLNNWTEAAQVLEQLEPSGFKPVDEATALFARAVHIRGNIESMSLPAAADEIASMLTSGPAQKAFLEGHNHARCDLDAPQSMP